MNETQQLRLAAQIQIEGRRQRQQETNAGVRSGTDKPTSRSDTPKKPQKKSKPRMLNAECKACIKEFKEYLKSGEPQSMQNIVRDYAAGHDGVSAESLYRRLNDNSVHWNPKAG